MKQRHQSDLSSVQESSLGSYSDGTIASRGTPLPLRLLGLGCPWNRTAHKSQVTFQGPRHFSGAVVLDAALLLMRAAPVLLGVRPPLHPVGEAGVAVIDVLVMLVMLVRVANVVPYVSVQVVAAMPAAGAAARLEMAAVCLLVL